MWLVNLKDKRKVFDKYSNTFFTLQKWQLTTQIASACQIDVMYREKGIKKWKKHEKLVLNFFIADVALEGLSNMRAQWYIARVW